MEPAADLTAALEDGHRRDRPAVAALLSQASRDPAVGAARRRWSDLLSAALGARFAADDALFVDHTLLVVTAGLVAHAVADLALDHPPRALLSGDVLAAAGLHGVVDRDCFSHWLLAVPGGESFLKSLADRLARLDWSAVDHDVLHRLYESAIAADTRKQLGEHYTPDWLAARIVGELPAAARVLDPACGSGTFLFHAVRRHLARGALADLCDHVAGIDLHPVAVALARVTYLLAIGRERLRERPALQIPVHLGDALQRLPLAPADVLLGNPPWLAYRFMPPAMKRAFTDESRARGLWHGARLATHQDLSALFVVRTVDMYLKPGGRFAFVMPAAVLDRGQYAGFRRGDFAGLHLAFERPWDLRRVRPHFFPIAAGVVFGRRADAPAAMPPPAIWTGRLDLAPPTLSIRDDPASDRAATLSPYSRAFLQGASLVPRLLFMVDRAPSPEPRIFVRSARSASEKPPWRDLPALAGAVESPFVHPVHLGETVLPYRLLAPRRAVLPCDARGLLADCRDHPGLAEWWQRAESTWLRHRASELLSLREQLDYHGKLSVQLPARTPRVVYAKSGMYLAAACLTDPAVLVDHKLYWSHVAGDDEARYLCAILNAAVTTARVRPLMSYGKDERDIDKFVWRLPIPRYDPADAEHRDLAALARDVEAHVAALPLPTDAHFTVLRRRIRLALTTLPAARAIEDAVARLLAGDGARVTSTRS